MNLDPDDWDVVAVLACFVKDMIESGDMNQPVAGVVIPAIKKRINELMSE